MINKRLINLCSESKKYILATVIASWVSALCNILIIISIGKVINDVYSQVTESFTTNNFFFDLRKIGYFIAFLLVVRFASNLLYGIFSHKASSTVKIKLRDMIYEKLLKLGLNYNESISTSAIVQASIEGVEALEIYFGKYLPQFFYSMLAPITLFVFLSFISFKAAMVFILCVPLIPISIIVIMRIAKKFLKEYWNSYSNLGDTFLDNLQGLTTLKVFNVDSQRHKNMNDEAESFRKVTMKVLSMQLNSITVMDLIAFGGSALGSIVALHQFNVGNINLGQVIIIILLSSEFFIPLRLLGSFFHVAMNGIAASDKIFTLLDSQVRSKVISLTNNQVAASASEISKNKLSISLSKVSFSYTGETDVIKNVSMTIPSNSFTAIVGESGSGKSTIASLILNNYQVDRGEISFNGVNIEQIDFEQLYNKVALVSTNSYIFNGTILDNLIIAKNDASETEITRALKLANLKSFVDELEDSLNTKVGEGGSLLSGGQKQRLALARAILADREVIVFDEATSNIDIESEEMIWSSINELVKKKTIVVISHRLANVKSADKIYVLNKGNLVEEGNHQQLMGKQGTYFKMVTEQCILEGRQVS